VPPSDRGRVSVVVPFLGDGEAAERTLAGLASLRLREGDELIVADNGGKGVVAALRPRGVTVLDAASERSSYHARNAGATVANGEWLLFMDADCTPEPNLLDAYFEAPVTERCGALAGQIEGHPDQRSFLARYTRSRNFFRQGEGLLAEAGLAATASLMVRRRAFDELGGFEEGIRSGGDVDLCRRLRLAGWTIEPRLEAVVHHDHRDSLGSFLAAIARYGAGSRWLNDRYPGESEPWPLVPGVLGAARDIVARLATGHLEEAAFRAVDALGLVAHVVGYARSNAAG
jgi:GT2 family glycosyltransferase